MKYRVLEVYDSVLTPCYRLQRSPDGDKWEFVLSGSDKTEIVRAMHRIAESPAEPTVIAQIES